MCVLAHRHMIIIVIKLVLFSLYKSKGHHLSQLLCRDSALELFLVSLD